MLDIQTHANYLHRLTSLIAIKVLAEAFQGEVLQTLLLPPVLRMAEDPVPNIRFNVCKTLKELVARVDNTTVSAQIKPVLTNMAQVSLLVAWLFGLHPFFDSRCLYPDCAGR